jgi:hypothetical protein
MHFSNTAEDIQQFGWKSPPLRDTKAKLQVPVWFPQLAVGIQPSSVDPVVVDPADVV